MSAALVASRPAGRSLASLGLSAPAPRDAQPIKAASFPAGMRDLLRPAALSRWMLPSLGAITPQYIEQVLRGALAGSHAQMWALFDLMEDTAPRIQKNLNQLKRAVIAMDWKLEPWAEEETPPTASALEKQKLISTALWRMRAAPDRDENDFRSTIYDILDAWAKGTSVLEVGWEIRKAGALGDITAPRATWWVPPENYAWSDRGYLGLAIRSDQSSLKDPRNIVIEQFPEHKFLIAVCKAKTGHPLAGAMLRPLAWWWCAANFSADWLLNYCQLFGLPFRWANYDTNASDATVNLIATQLENMGSAGWAAFPAGTTLELKEASKTGNATPQGDLLDRADKQYDIYILGQTLTSEVRDTGGALATAGVHQSVLAEVKQACADFAANVINQQFIPAILLENYGEDSECPEFCPEPETQEDTKANADTIKVMVDMGMKVSVKWAHKKLGVPLASPGEEVIERASAPAEAARPSTLDPRPSPEESPNSYKAKQTAGGFDTTARDLLARAFATDLAPIRARIEAVLRIEDDSLMIDKASALLAKLPQLTRDITADPISADYLANIMSTEMVNAIETAKKERA